MIDRRRLALAVLLSLSACGGGGAQAEYREVAPGFFFMTMPAEADADSYLAAARAKCEGLPRCTVQAWRAPDSMPSAYPMTDAQSAAQVFAYSASSESPETARWNCRVLPRSDRSECLNTAAPEGAAGR